MEKNQGSKRPTVAAQESSQNGMSGRTLAELSAQITELRQHLQNAEVCVDAIHRETYASMHLWRQF